MWERTEFPQSCNRLACQFLMVGEPLLRMVEHPEVVATARRILGAEELHVGACGIGDASKAVSADGQPRRQVHWHADGGPGVRQVSFRTALDRHDAANGPLRILPGSQHRSGGEVAAELLQLELATGVHEEPPELCFARHPGEIEVPPRPAVDSRVDTLLLARHRAEDQLRTEAGHGLELLSRRRQEARPGGGEAPAPRLARLARGAAAALGAGAVSCGRPA